VARPFRRRNAMAVWDMHFGPNMTPMVDVVMVILIFYMASTSFVGSEWFLRTAIPQQAAAAATPRERPLEGDPFALPPAQFDLRLSRHEGRTVASGSAFGADRALELSALPARLRELAAGTSADDLALVIRSEPDVPYGDVIRAHDAATAAGIAKVGLMDVGP
jgi:biopolymer transport protein ExbD